MFDKPSFVARVRLQGKIEYIFFVFQKKRQLKYTLHFFVILFSEPTAESETDGDAMVSVVTEIDVR